jgi:hypothetical protein
VNRLHAYVVSVLIIGAVLYPVLGDPEHDDFPLSTYPMFARPRAPTTTIHAAVAVARDGRQTPVPPALVGTGETMQAVRILSRSLRAGPDVARDLCAAIAARVARSADPTFRDAQHIALVSHEVDVLRYASGARDVPEAQTHLSCVVPRQQP